jgi:Protein of unknown function (DUF3240)
MVADLCRLTMVYPPASEGSLLSLMLDMEPPVPGFTTWRGAGHGLSFENATHGERVSGQVARGIMTSIMSRDTADRVLERIRQDSPIPHLTYWIELVVAAGRLT